MSIRQPKHYRKKRCFHEIRQIIGYAILEIGLSIKAILTKTSTIMI